MKRGKGFEVVFRLALEARTARQAGVLGYDALVREGGRVEVVVADRHTSTVRPYRLRERVARIHGRA